MYYKTVLEGNKVIFKTDIVEGIGISNTPIELEVSGIASSDSTFFVSGDLVGRGITSAPVCSVNGNLKIYLYTTTFRQVIVLRNEDFLGYVKYL